MKSPKLFFVFIRRIFLLCIFKIVILQYPLIGQDIDSNLKYSKKTYIYKIVDKHEIKADVHKIPNKDIQPVIIWIHGGALIFGAREGINIEFLDKWIENGYTVVSIDYRLAPETKLESIIEDIKDAYYWVRNQGPDLLNIDPDRIAVAGGSAGGYLTLMTGFSVNPPPKALVSFYGYGNITGPWYSKPDPFYSQKPEVTAEEAFNVVGDTITTNAGQFSIDGRYKFYLYCRQKGIWPNEVGGHNPASEEHWFRRFEPLQNVSINYPPTILLHGEMDTDVPFEQSRLMAKELERHHVDFEFVHNSEWDHAFDYKGLNDGKLLSWLREANQLENYFSSLC